MKVDQAPEEVPVIRSAPYVVNANLSQPSLYNFRRHFTLPGRYFYRLHSSNAPTFSRIDTMNGDVAMYTPAEGSAYQKEIQQLHYFKPINEEFGILVYIHVDSTQPQEVCIALIDVCHEKQTYTVLSRDKFRCFQASTIAQGTLIQNMKDLDQMVCVFTDSSSDDGLRDQSCVTFFEIKHLRVRITKILFTKTAVYFPYLHGNFIDGVFEDEDEDIHHLQRFDTQTEKYEVLSENLLQFLENGEYVSDFCWQPEDLYMFVLTEDLTRVYIQKFDLVHLKFTRINFPVNEFALVNKLSRFYINTDSIICYCETVDDGEMQTDRFVRVPMRRPDKLLTYSWLAVRNHCETKKKSVYLPMSFDYLSPLRPLLQLTNAIVEDESSNELENRGMDESNCFPLPQLSNDFFSDE